MTFFDVFRIVAVVALAWAGAWFGGHWGPQYGRFVGAAGGLMLGLAVGASPWLLARVALSRRLGRASSEELHQMLASERAGALYVIAELVRRGEDPEVFRPIAEELLRSERGAYRKVGQDLARTWYDDIADTSS